MTLAHMVEMIVTPKPIEVTIVNPEPTNSRGAVSALSVENCGESPTTKTPQTSIAMTKIGVGAMLQRSVLAHGPFG